jgi:hypothetical protein
VATCCCVGVAPAAVVCVGAHSESSSKSIARASGVCSGSTPSRRRCASAAATRRQ